ncbi:MAG: U32 family peptidase [Clostridiales bacterium]|nr:U32 family peptidase [Clostridiales bacterium]
MEILAPAGSLECIRPAVISGADAVYLGADEFSARASASNFDSNSLADTIKYCHNHNVKVYLALNTLLRDSELERALKVAKSAVSSGIDAIIVQDLGLAYLLKKACPDIRLHASTQMSVHTPAGAKLLYMLGFKRVVLSRELSKDEIKEIVESCPIEVEVFVHGALCMCVSGQCYFSAIAGCRSGNRGRCAQPCRLPHSVNESKGGYALSLKDLSLVKYLKELEDLGVHTAKIEGRMKRPEYVAAAVTACRQMLDNGKLDTQTENMLKDVFSRSGFTDGYYTSHTGKEMFGYRQRDDVISADKALFDKIHQLYRKERQTVPLNAEITVRENENITLTLADDKNNTVTVSGDKAEKALNRPITEERIREQISKTGDTPFYISSIKVDFDGTSTVRITSLNNLRRMALEKLTDMRCKIKERQFADLRLDFTKKQSHKMPKRYVLESCSCTKDTKDGILFVPLDSNADDLLKLIDKGYTIGLSLPRGMFGSESKISEILDNAKNMGIEHILTGNLGGVALGLEKGFTVHGDFGLNITNSYSLLFLKELGVADAVASIELTSKQIGELARHIPVGILSEGYIPMMLTRNCPVKSAGISCAQCGKKSFIKDDKGHTFAVYCTNGCSEILNCSILKADKSDVELSKADFEIVRNDIENYINKKTIPYKHTHGLYHRGVL